MGRQWIRPGPRPLRRPGPPTCRARRGHRSGPTRRLRLSRHPEPSDSPTEAEPSDTPAETESPPEPSDSPVASETPTPTLTSAPTEAETSEAPLPSTEATSPGTTDEPAEGDADEDSEGVPAWVWWLLAALAVALAVGIPLLVRSRRSKAWRASDLAAAEQEVVWLVPGAVCPVFSAPARESRRWADGPSRPIAYSLSTTGSRASRQLPRTTPAGSVLARCATPYEWLAVAWTASATSATDQSASAEVGGIASDLASTVWPPEPAPPRS